VDSLRIMTNQPVRTLLFLVAATTSAAPLRAADPPWVARGATGMVASDSAAASAVGRDILKSGGNAVDAAVAVSFALGVTRPYSTGLGGGGFTILRLADGRVFVQDCRETAPAQATADMYARSGDDTDIPEQLYGYRAAAVPGVLAGRCQLLKEHGTMPLARLVAPSITLASDGFPVDAHYRESAESALKRYKKYPKLQEYCRYVYDVHLRGGNLPAIGDTVRQPALAGLLREIARGGAEFFYLGPLADAIDRHMRDQGGVITKEDLAWYLDHGVRVREPVMGDYRGRTIISMPPPSSGGITLVQALNILEPFDMAKLHREDPAAAMHVQIEAMKHAFADRARWFGDTDFVKVPVGLLLSKKYAAELASRIKPDRTAPIDSYGVTQLPDDSGTSHFSIVDRFGNVVVSTETINTSFGSLAAIDEWGLILNNEMDDFAAEPGKPNAYGLIQSSRNAIEPHKRPLSSMAPTIVLKGDKPVLMLGASGGPRIISSVLNVMLGVIDFSDDPARAMLRRRPHHQWMPDTVFFDADPPQALREGLERRGQKIASEHRKGIVQAIVRVGDEWVGVSDPRKGGRPAGY